MNPTGNQSLFAAYLVTWIIHIAYILYLGSRAKKVADEVRELERTAGPPTAEKR